ncbi:MAG: hypothetical protein H9W81_17400 [Enterococcus sp.]|nr:hypothetical protein [Enterococcus sp.]
MEQLSTLPMIVMGCIVGALIILFLMTFVIIKLIEKHQKKKRDQSLPEGESVNSEFADFLAEKYKEEL